MKKAELVVKSNRLIEASYRLGMNEQRIILYSICRCREEQKTLFPDLPVTITADAFSKQFPSINSIDKTNVYRQLKDAMDTLYDRSVTIHDTDPASGHARVTKTRWISAASYVDGAGHIQVIFTPEVIKYITRLEAEFTSYQLEKVGNMTSAHAVRIYELLAQHRDIGMRTLNLTWLRETLQIGPDEYKLTADFKKWVIESAIDQINKHSDLTVSYKPKKTGRAITDFVFKIKDRERKSKAASTASDQAAREKLEVLGQQRFDTENDEQF
ncbi:Initiator RepB protein [Janthinobacterium sp. ROICE36]|uniref:RepB family plasmid replication initiator protein n=1 Tax=Janthinobacterium sp. ROICE36 TaxID=2048670 RepID=UPI000C7EB377|nr:RepB family plasmid replication initiator protein [Janthinobacterium sp. ROICE36]PLY42130.1 Initiator RepB protein [Janthinobacterium sp. ROICE36]